MRNPAMTGRRLAGRGWRWFRRVEPPVLASVLLIAAALFAFVRLADEMVEGDTHAFDRWVLLALRNPADPADPLGPAWFAEMARDVTALGSTILLTLATLAVAGYLLIVRRTGAALLILGSAAGGTLVSFLLKGWFERARPDLVPHLVEVHSASFPSSHAMLSTVTYLTLGALLAWAERRRAAKIYVLGVAIAVALLVGLSRVYLGVHWPTDVLAGWCVGAAWAMLCWTAALWLQRRGRVRPPAPAGDRPEAGPAADQESVRR